jgi:hypothetical protein
MKRVNAFDSMEGLVHANQVATAREEAGYALNIAGVYHDSVTEIGASKTVAARGNWLEKSESKIIGTTCILCAILTFFWTPFVPPSRPM